MFKVWESVRITGKYATARFSSEDVATVYVSMVLEYLL